jgi:hypothetical protein
VTAWIADILVLVGLAVMTLGVYGILRFPDVYTRLHASGKASCIDLAGLCVDGVGSRSAAGDGEVGQDRDRCPQHAGDLLDGVAVLLAGGA